MKRKKQVYHAENNEYKETDSTNSVQSSYTFISTLHIRALNIVLFILPGRFPNIRSWNRIRLFVNLGISSL